MSRALLTGITGQDRQHIAEFLHGKGYEVFFSPAEVDLLIGDPTKAKEKLGWAPAVDFPELVRMMARNDVVIGAAVADLLVLI
jgi:GDP-D-mannose dehydratase